MNTSILKTTIAIALFAVTFTSCAKTSVKTSTPIKTNTTQTTPKVEQTTPTIRKVDVQTFKTETEGKTVQLVDVRTPNEFKAGHLANADNVNVFDGNFMTQMAKYKKDEPVYVYCRSGGRSMKAARKLKAQGYNVVNMNGGFMGWSSKGFKSVK